MHPDKKSNISYYINRSLQFFITLVSSISLVIAWQSWQDWQHLVYDIPSAIVFSLFLGQIGSDIKSGFYSPELWGKLIALFFISIVTLGRVIFNWPISGHLTGLLTVAVIQTISHNIKFSEKITYWFPVPVILLIRWIYFDQAGHSETYFAIIAGAIFSLFVYLFQYLNKSTK